MEKEKEEISEEVKSEENKIIEEKPKKKKEKKFNIILYFILMIIVFAGVEILSEIVSAIPVLGAFNSKYGQQMIGELFWAATMLIVVLIFGNSYIFTNKKDNFFKGILLGLPLVLVGALIFVENVGVLAGQSFINIVTLLLYCIFIGITEEFMCRAWLQNEFIERYGKTHRQVIISILLASLIFGLIHFTNLMMGQTLLETIAQVIQATSAGMLFGAIYYRTKNIWSVAAIHAFWDFAIFIGEMEIVKDCTYGTASTGIIIYELISSFAVILLNVFLAILLLRKNKIEPMLNPEFTLTEDEKKKDNKNRILLLGAAVGSFLIITICSSIFGSTLEADYEKYETCYSYQKGTINEFNETHFPKYNEYQIVESVIVHAEDTEIEGQEPSAEENNTRLITLTVRLEENEENQPRAIIVDSPKDYHHDIKVDGPIDQYFVTVYNNFVYTVINAIDKNDGGSIVYYSRIPVEELDDTAEFLDKYEASFKSFKLPAINKIGYMTYKNNPKAYPVFFGEYYDFFIDEIDGNTEMLLIDYK